MLFRFKVISYPSTSTKAAPGEVRITFCPSGLAGRIKCKMTLALESLSSAEPFSIVQDLTLIVAREAVVESMAPVTPYAPAKPERRGWKHTLRGEKISFRRKIVFTVKSLEYEVPGKLRKALWKKRRDDQENALHKIIPDALNGRSLPTFWSTLLHAEELQVEYVPAAIVFSRVNCRLFVAEKTSPHSTCPSAHWKKKARCSSLSLEFHPYVLFFDTCWQTGRPRPRGASSLDLAWG